MPAGLTFLYRRGYTVLCLGASARGHKTTQGLTLLLLATALTLIHITYATNTTIHNNKRKPNRYSSKEFQIINTII